MRRTATIIVWSILLIGSGYALGIGAPGIALPASAAALLLLPLILRTPASHASVGRRVAERTLGNALQSEIARSRRHNRSFAVLRLPLGSSPPTGAVPLDARPTNIGEASLRAKVRVVDHVWSEQDALYVLLPESGAQGLRMFLARLELTLSADGLLGARTAIYPDDGPTEGAILQHLREGDRAAYGPAPRMTIDLSDEAIDPQPPLAD